MLTVPALAKINLTLEVLAKRRDGFHEIRSVIQTISFCDRLHFQPADTIEFGSNLSDWVAGESLVSRTVSLLKDVTGCSKGATIEVNKCIPLLSGLGGDSSDAAATLRGLNKLWELGLSREQLLELAWRLGSDVAFFLYGGTALVEGRGEIVTPLPPVPPVCVVLLMPPVPRMKGKTGEIYAALGINHYTDGQVTRRLVEGLREGKGLNHSLLFNTFENIAFAYFSGLGVYRSHLAEVGAGDVHVAGSGPTLFTLVEDRERAEELCFLLKQRRLEPYWAETLGGIEEV